MQILKMGNLGLVIELLERKQCTVGILMNVWMKCVVVKMLIVRKCSTPQANTLIPCFQNFNDIWVGGKCLGH